MVRILTNQSSALRTLTNQSSLLRTLTNQGSVLRTLTNERLVFIIFSFSESWCKLVQSHSSCSQLGTRSGIQTLPHQASVRADVGLWWTIVLHGTVSTQSSSFSQVSSTNINVAVFESFCKVKLFKEEIILLSAVLLIGKLENILLFSSFTARSQSEMLKYSFFGFGLFLQRNASVESELGEYSMYTGEGDPYRLSNIHSYNNKQVDTDLWLVDAKNTDLWLVDAKNTSFWLVDAKNINLWLVDAKNTNLWLVVQELKFWNESRCNAVHGSDGASFNPYIKKEDTLWFFNDQLCRALPLVYDQTIDQEGLPGLRFVPREDVFMSSEKYPQ